ncbi:MAG: serine/threonine protein kinase [Aphanothece sp. CMT-3BRIN-NPC111]|jgi:serine/threonine protein kinase|nr:serine/threonine protein kinase [Aphanothece sp. CMT-3BRIN-NPC111]
MICCLNPYCYDPLNPDDLTACKSCGTPLIPLLRDRFKIIEPIGRGGFGKTYLAEDIDKLNERCIIKQLTYQASNEEEAHKVQQLFQQEARQLQQLGEHPQIPALFAYFQSNKSFFLAQQLIEGQNLLKEFEQKGAFSEAKIRYILQNLLPVLQYVHTHNVIHRDIKPDNIIGESVTGKLVLIDFGVSKVIAPTAQTQTGTMIGSQGYASPEQVKGKVKPSSDLFSLGVTCFHLLSGIDPSVLWTDRGFSWVDDWQRYLGDTLDPQLAYVLNRLLNKDRQQRYQSANEALRDLQGVPQHQPSGYTTTRSTYSFPAQSSSSNLPARSPVSQTSASRTSNSSRQPVSVTVVRDKPISPLTSVFGAGIVLVVGVIGGFIWLSSQIPRYQTPVTSPLQSLPLQQVSPTPNHPPSNYPPRNQPPPSYPPPSNYPPPNYPPPAPPFPQP